MKPENKLLNKLLEADAIDSVGATPAERAAFEESLAQWLQSKPASRTILWRKIMKSKFTKLTAAAVVMIAVIIGISQFDSSIGGGTVVFGQVLGYIQKRSYTFDLTVTVDTVEEGSGPARPFTQEVMVWESGRIRFDLSAGGQGSISSITDLNEDRTILLFHQNKTAVIQDEPVLNKFTGSAGILSFCTQPIENLWNLRDGTEEPLGEKEINGQSVTGFRIFQEDPYFQYDMTIWANSENGLPTVVEMIAKPLDESYPAINWLMENFDLDVELDKEVFSLDLPEGYTLAYQKDLEKLSVDTEPSDESKKIVQVFTQWSEGKEDEAIKSLLGIDWTKKIEFGKKPYIFSLTEKGYISLKAEDQKQVMEETMATLATMRAIVRKAAAMGQASIAAQDYEKAEQYFESSLQLGNILAGNQEHMIIVRMVGVAIQKISLQEMISLYTTTDNSEKRQAAERQLHEAEAERDRIRKQATGQ